jgi:hypothetical protein
VGNAVWLFLSLPTWFFSTVGNPLGADILSAIPFAGTVCLALGVGIGICKRQPQLLWFLAPVALSQGFVAVAGLFRGTLRGSGATLVLVAFLGLQVVLVVFALFRSKNARLTAIPLALFCVTYTLFAGFIAGMAFSDDWL